MSGGRLLRKAHLYSKLLGVNLGEGGECEGPAVQACAEADSPLFGVDLGVSQLVICIGGHDDIGGLNDPPVAIIGLLTIQHELQEAAIQLVHRQHWPDTFSQCLPAAAMLLNGFINMYGSGNALW